MAKTLSTVVFLAVLSTFAVAQATTGSSSGNSVTAPDPQTVPQGTQGSGERGGGNSAMPSPSASQDDGALQSRIENAIRNEPSLGSSHVSVNVSDSIINLSGSVGSSKDKQTAERIAESFDGNRQLNDKIVVTGHGHSDLAPDHPAMNNGGTGAATNPSAGAGANSQSTPPPQQ